MKILKSVSCALVLTCVFGVPAFAGETSTPPGEMSGPPCAAPGSMQTPGCEPAPSSADSTNPGVMNGPPSAEILTARGRIALQILLGV